MQECRHCRCGGGRPTAQAQAAVVDGRRRTARSEGDCSRALAAGATSILASSS